MPFRHRLPRSAALAGAFAAVVPDFDVIGFRLGIDYADLLGHRGLTHSIAFAVALGGLGALLLFRTLPQRSRTHLWFYLALATASHGLFDALTDGGLGVALLAPFSNERFFFPWRPIEVSPIGLSRIVSARGLRVFASELIWVGLPALAVVLGGGLASRPRRIHSRR